MARVPTYQQQTGARGDTSPAMARVPNTSGGGIGEGLAAVGDAFGAVDRKQARESLDAANRSVAEFSAWQARALADLETKPVSEIDQHVKAYETEASKARGKIMQTSRRPETRRFLEVSLQDLDARSAGKVRQITTVAATGAKIANIEAALAAGSSSVEADPNTYVEELARTVYSIENSGLQGENQNRAIAAAQDAFARASVRGQIAKSPADAIAALSDPNTADRAIRALDPAARAALLKAATEADSDARVGGHVANVLRAYEGSFRAGPAALSDALKDPNLNDDERALLASQVREQSNLLADRRRQENVDGLAQLEAQQAANDPRSVRTAASLYDRGAITETQYAAAVGYAERAKRVLAERETDANTLRSVIATGGLLDPKDNDARKAVSQYFDDAVKGFPPGTQAYALAAQQLTRQTNIAPEGALSWARATLLGGKEGDAALAADLVARIEQASPQAFDFQVDEKTRSIAADVSDAVRGGVDPVTAVAIARENAKRPPMEAKAFESLYSQAVRKDPNTGALSSLLNGSDRYDPNWIGGAPDAPIRLQAEFEQGVQRYFASTGGDLKKARERAFADVNRKWGRTEVNGKPELLEYAPEVMFPGLTGADVRADLADTLKALPDAPTPDKVRLIPFDGTARTGGQRWHLGTVDEYGAPDVLRDAQGRPLQYVVPVQKEAFAAARARQTEAAMAAARAGQAARAEAQQLDAAATEAFARTPAGMRGR